MNHWLVIGILAGIASGVLYFSAAAGNLAGMMLASFASFPLFVAGLGWGMPTVLLGVGVLLAGYALGISLKAGFGAALALGAAPILVTWLALQNRPAAASPSAEGEVADAGIEWYPEGRLVVWMSLLAAAGIALFVLLNSSGAGGFQANMNTQLEPLFKALAEQPNAPPAEQLAQLKQVIVAALPGAMSAVTVLSMVLSLALAIAVVKRSGISLRPWASFGELRFPRWSVWVLSAATLATFLPRCDRHAWLGRSVSAVLGFRHSGRCGRARPYSQQRSTTAAVGPALFSADFLQPVRLPAADPAGHDGCRLQPAWPQTAATCLNLTFINQTSRFTRSTSHASHSAGTCRKARRHG
jgi:hypothetical protein